jgi:hypothetical protein
LRLCDGTDLSGSDPFMSRRSIILSPIQNSQFFLASTQGKPSEKRLNPEIASCLIAWG